MPSKEIITNTIPFQVYSFDAVFEAIQPYLKDGFKFDLIDNFNYPKVIGTTHVFAIQEYRTEITPDKAGVLPEDATPEETQALLEAVTEIPTITVPKTRRAKANLQG